jgi:peptide/nickel transport system substrate-binding protein
MSRRWSLLSGVALAALLANAAEAQTLRYIPQAKLSVFDTTINQSSISHQHAYMIWDTLFGADKDQRPQPQMVESFTLSADGLVYTMKLRPGLKFHDGTPVTAKDAVASIKRWAPKDTNGLIMLKQGMTVAAVDDRTFTLTLKEAWGSTIDSMAKMSAKALYVYPEKDASMDGATPITSNIGSGPFKFVANEFVPDSKVVYAKNTDYVPRSEPASWYAGGKVVRVDKVEWVIITDAATAVAALDRGEVDWYETPPLDLLPTLKRNPNLTAKVHNPNGAMGIMRPNHLHPPFNNVKARQALYYLIDQAEYMRVMAGDPEYWTVCDSLFMCGTPSATSAGAEMINKPDIEKARALFKEAGYNGEPVVVLYPTDHPSGPAAQVTADRLKKAGVNVELQAMDWATLTTRRSSKNPPAQGGWNLFHTRTDAVSAMSPLANNPASSGCDRSWFGWACDPETEKLRLQWAREPDDAKRKQILETVQTRLYANGNFAVVGQYTMPSAYRANIDGLIKAPVLALWNVEKR